MDSMSSSMTPMGKMMGGRSRSRSRSRFLSGGRSRARFASRMRMGGRTRHRRSRSGGRRHSHRSHM